MKVLEHSRAHPRRPHAQGARAHREVLRPRRAALRAEERRVDAGGAQRRRLGGDDAAPGSRRALAARRREGHSRRSSTSRLTPRRTSRRFERRLNRLVADFQRADDPDGRAARPRATRSSARARALPPRGRRCVASGRRRALAPPRLPEAVVGGDDQPVRLAGRAARAPARRDPRPRRDARSRSPRSGPSQFLPFILFTLPAGVWVDRLPRRPILIVGDFGRAALLATIPIAYVADVLTLGQLFVVGFLVGICTVFFDVAYQSYLPSLVEREQIIEGNSKLEISRSAAQVGGPGLGGVLVQIFTAPYAVLARRDQLPRLGAVPPADPQAEEPPERRDGRRPQARACGRSSRRACASSSATRTSGRRPAARRRRTSSSSVAFSIILVFAVRELGLSAGVIGIVFSIGAVGLARRGLHGDAHLGALRDRPDVDRRRRPSSARRRCSCALAPAGNAAIPVPRRRPAPVRVHASSSTTSSR